MLRKFKTKFSNMNLQLKIVFWFTVANFFATGVGLLTTPIFTRVLTTEEYGLYGVFNSYSTVLCVIATLNLHLTAIYNALTKRPNPKEEIVSSYQSLSMVVSIIFAVIAIVFRKPLADLMDLPEIIVVAMFVSFVFVEPYQLWLVYKRYQFSYQKPVILSISITIISPIISLLAIYLTPGDRGVARVLAYVVVCTILPGLFFYFVNYKKSKTFKDKELWTYALGFAIPLIPHYLSETLLNQTDKIMINHYFSTAEAGIYHVAFTAAGFVRILMTAINSAYIPWQFQKLKEKDYKSMERVSYSILIVLALIITLITLFAPEVIMILAGEKYNGAVALIPTLGASVFFNYMYQLYARVEMYCEKTSYTVIATFSATILNIVLNILFMPTFGYVFAGVSTLLSHMLFVIMHYFACKKVCRECLDGAKIYDGRIMLGISAVLTGIAIFTTWSYDYIVIRYIFIGVLLLIAFLFRKKIMAVFKMISKKPAKAEKAEDAEKADGAGDAADRADADDGTEKPEDKRDE